LAAAGVSIYSTYKNGMYVTMSGTSMACPHVTGAAALAWASGLTSNTAVRTRLRSTAEDLGSRGFDTLYGYGLVDAQRAAKPTATAGIAAADADITLGIQITAPQDGTSVSGITEITAGDEMATQAEFFIEETSIGVDTDGTDGWSVAWDTSAYPDGQYTITATATDAVGQTTNHSVGVTVSNAEEAQATTVSVQSVTYGTGDGNRDLLISLHVVDNLENPVPNASVLVGVFVNGRLHWTLSGVADSDGSVSLSIAKARPGLYEVTVAEVTAEGLTWDGETPPNEFRNSR
jgi:hypothetical protein